MSNEVPQNVETSEYMPQIEQIERDIYRLCAASLYNKYRNPKYQFYADEPEQEGEVGRINVRSVTQYAPEGDTNEAGVFDPTLGRADCDYGGEGDYGRGVIIFHKQEDGALSWEISGDLSDVDAITNALTSVVSS